MGIRIVTLINENVILSSKRCCDSVCVYCTIIQAWLFLCVVSFLWTHELVQRFIVSRIGYRFNVWIYCCDNGLCVMEYTRFTKAGYDTFTTREDSKK